MDEGVHGDKNVGKLDVCCGPFAAVAAAELGRTFSCSSAYVLAPSIR